MFDSGIDAENFISVSELNARIRELIDYPYFKGIEVFGEVSGFKFSGPHAYFTLRDKDAQIQCVSFNASRAYIPKDGESVIIRGNLDFYIKRGTISLQVRAITPVGQGLLFLEFERLKARLQAEGLFDEAHKKPIPSFVNDVLVVTSKTGAVIRDIVTTVRRKNPIINITVRDARVQGEGAAREICNALKRADVLGYDVIIIARGGGSLEDLAPFYDEELARTIYAMNTPVVSAVGHETDYSLCDFVADARAATPTAAGELVAFDYYGCVNALKEIMARLSSDAVKKYSSAESRAQVSFEKLKSLAIGFYTARLRRVENAVARAKSGVERSFNNASHRTALAMQRAKSEVLAAYDNASHRADNAIVALDKLSPLKTLSRGYFRLQCGKETINGVESVKVGDTINATGRDGTLSAQVTEVNFAHKEDR